MSPKTVVEILAGREWQMDPLLDIRRRLRLCLGYVLLVDRGLETTADLLSRKPVDPDEDFAAADIQPPPEPDAGPQGGRNPQSPNRAQQRPHEPSRAYDAASPQRINGPSGRAYNGPDDLGLNVLDDFGMDEEFESHQAQNHQPVRRPGTTEPPRSRRLGPATGSQKTPERDFSKRWNATGVIEVSPPVRNLSHVIFPSQLAKKTPIQQRVAHGEWDDVDDDDLWNDLDPDQLAATGSAQDRVVATPARPSSRQLPRDGVARISLELAGGGKKRPASPGSNLDDMDDDLLLDLDDPLPVKKAAPAPSMPIVVYLVDDDEIEFVPESSRRDQVQAGPSRLRDIAKDRPAVSSFSKNTSAETDMLSIDQVEDVIRNRTSASAWLDVRVVWYSGLRLVDEDNTELELNLIVRDGSGDLAIKFSDKVGEVKERFPHTMLTSG